MWTPTWTSTSTTVVLFRSWAAQGTQLANPKSTYVQKIYTITTDCLIINKLDNLQIATVEQLHIKESPPFYPRFWDNLSLNLSPLSLGRLVVIDSVKRDHAAAVVIAQPWPAHLVVLSDRSEVGLAGGGFWGGSRSALASDGESDWLRWAPSHLQWQRNQQQSSKTCPTLAKYT